MPLESTVLESLSCSSCFTHYGLRPERVHPGIRRARCFQCGSVFSVEEAIIHRLLNPSPAPALAEASPTATLERIQPEDLLELDGFLSAETPVPAPEPESETALTLGDLEGTEEDILEKTLVIEPPLDPEEKTMGGLTSEDPGSYASAKDAIAKLLGDAPTPVAHERRNTGRASSMDVEATLDALENTLGGTPVRGLGAPSMSLKVEATKPNLGSTVRLSPTELQAAMAAGAPSPSQAPTVAIPSLAATQPAFAIQPQAAAVPEANPAAATGDPNLLKIQVGQETFQNVTLDQLANWIEQGRVQDWHMVARQFSDNWIEAGKVPSLRPVFERVRRLAPQTSVPPTDAPSTFETAPVKKGLFGWMSNRA
jgi:hypothetical protein